MTRITNCSPSTGRVPSHIPSPDQFMSTTEHASLKQRWEEHLRQNPKTRIRDAAATLGVSEAELLATRVGDGVTRLEGDWKDLLKEFPKLGRVLCLTRNEAAVHERYGEFEHLDFFHGMGQVLGPDIDLRLFLSHWKFGFAVTDQTAEGERQSFQFFDAHGDAVLKVYLLKHSDYGCYGVFLHQFRAAEQSPEVAVTPAPAAPPARPDAEVDVEGFRAGWLAMKDTHAFYPLIGKFRIGRLQALRLAPEGFAHEVPVASIRRMLESASASGLPIMVFIGSRGCVQIHTGPVKNIKMFGEDWLNVLDDDFNMHLRLPLVDSAWVVRKPTLDGDITALEIYDAAGENLVIFYGKRKPGQPEDPAWRELLAQSTTEA